MMTHARKATSGKIEPRPGDKSGQFPQKAANCVSQRPAIRSFPAGCRTDRAKAQGSMRDWWSDARHFQIVALSSLLAINFISLDFGAKPLYSARPTNPSWHQMFASSKSSMSIPSCA
jgi:hypothetical protein